MKWNYLFGRALSLCAVVALALFGASSLAQTGEPKAAKELSARLWTEYGETLKTADPVKIAGWFTKDAILIYPDTAELYGRDSIQAVITPAFKNIKFLRLSHKLNHVAIADDQLFTFATLDETYQRGNGPEVQSRARCGVVWQRQVDNTWLISHFLVNYAKP